MPTVAERLARMAREAQDPEDRAWAAQEYQAETGRALERQQTAPGPWRESFIARTPVGQMEEAKAARAPEYEVPTGRAGLLGAGQGASFGTTDELGGAVIGAIEGTRPGRWIGERLGLLSRDAMGALRGHKGQVIEDQGFADSYRGGRDTLRQDLDMAREQHPYVTTGAEIGAAVLNPIKAPIRGPGLLRAAGRGALEGAAYAAGTSDADITRGEVEDFATDVGIGAGGGALFGGAGEGVLKAGRGIRSRLAATAPQRIITEAAEGGGAGAATATARKHLRRAEDAIAEEVIGGPQGDDVRRALRGPGKEGREALAPILDDVGKQREAAYGAFTAAGRDTIDATEYAARIHDEILKTRKLSEKRGLERVLNDFTELVQRNGDQPLTLQDLRAFTTEIQGYAASAIGGLNEHASAKLKNRLAAVATGAMDDMLTEAAEGVPELEQAAQAIRATNRRTNALLTGDKALKSRQDKERTGSAARRIAQAAAGPTALGGVAAIASDDDDKVENALLGAGAGFMLPRMLGAGAGLYNRGMTSAAIRAARNPNPRLLSPGAGDVARRAMLPPLSLLDLARLQRDNQE